MSDRGPSLVAEAKERLSIPALWELRGWPGKPGKSCKFPDGSDKRASASVYADGQLLKCFRSGRVFDAPALLAEIEGMAIENACREFIRLAGLAGVKPASLPPPPRREARREPERIKPTFPPLSPCTPADVAALSRLRGVSPDAVRMAEDRGLLLFAESREGRSWIVADSSRWIGIARRMDGRGWECLGGAKARMLRGTWASWPIGIREAESFPAIALVEGGPDLLAAFHFAIEQDVAGLVAPVCMASSGISFPGDVLPRFEGKRARVFLDADSAGAAAFVRWSDQMREAGAVVDGFSFDGLTRSDGERVKDLNDVCFLSADSWERWGDVLAACMKFAPARPSPAPDEPLPPPVPAASADSGFLKNMTHTDRAILTASGFAGDPVILKAVELFKGRNLFFSCGQPEGEQCPA